MNGYLKKKFPDRLKELRNSKKLSQQNLADLTGVVRETIAKYETGKRNPALDDLITFSNFFNTTIDYLLGLTNNKTSDMLLLSVCDYTGLSESAVLNIIDHYGTWRKQEFVYIYKWEQDGDMEHVFYNKIVRDIIDWLFDLEDPEHSPIAELVELLAYLKEDSMKCVKFCKENEDPDYFGDFSYDNYIVLKTRPDIKVYPVNQSKSQFNKIDLNNKVDNDRYTILKYIENLSNQLAERNDEPNS